MTRLKEINSVAWLPSVWDRRGAHDGEALVGTVDYVGRYINRAAISNSRLIGIEGEEVLFRYKDNRNGGRWATKAIPGVEFIGRFLQHRLPKGLRHIRRFGFMGPRVATERLNKIRAILGIGRNEADASTGESEEPKPTERDEEPDGPAPRRCRQCDGGQMLLVAETPRPTVAQLMQMPPSMEPWWPMPRPEPCETPLNLIPRKEPPANSRQVQLHLPLSAGLCARWKGRPGDAHQLSLGCALDDSHTGATPGALSVRRQWPNRASHGSHFAPITTHQRVLAGPDAPLHRLTARRLAVSALGEPYEVRTGTFY